MLEGLLQFDKDLFLWLNALGNERWDGFWMFMTRTLNSLPLYLLLLYLSIKALGWKRTLVVVVAVALTIVCTDQLSNFFKYGLGRLRPCHDPEVSGTMRLVKSYCGGKFGFFSAHAANAFGPAIFFVSLFRGKVPYIGMIMVLWACLVAYSRIYIGVHYPLDVIGGALVGAFFGWLFSKLARITFQKMAA